MGLRIAVNTRFLLPKRLEGLGRFTFEVMQRWVKNQPDAQFVFLFDRKPHERFVFGPNVTALNIPPQARHPWLWNIWFHHSLRFPLRRYKPDLFVSPDGFLNLNFNRPQLPVIHDLAFEHDAYGTPSMVQHYYRKYFPQYAAKARRIATVSHFSARDIAEQYKVPMDKIDVVYNGASDIFRAHSEAEKQAVRDKFSESKSYFLFVGALHPRKNVENLLRSFDIFKKNDNAGTKLLITGRKAWANADMERVFHEMEHREDVLFIHGANDKEVAALTASAVASVNISWFEGFGLPVLEAMQSGTPVICAAHSAMQEVAEEACLITDPASPEQIAAAMTMLMKDEKLPMRLSAAGLERAKFFSWDKTADLLWQSALKCLE